MILFAEAPEPPPGAPVPQEKLRNSNAVVDAWRASRRAVGLVGIAISYAYLIPPISLLDENQRD